MSAALRDGTASDLVHTNHAQRLNVWLLAPLFWLLSLGLVALVLLLASHVVVAHSIHAIQVSGDRYIHGNSLACVAQDKGDQCTREVQGQPLVVTTVLGPNRYGPRTTVVTGCSASFAGNTIACKPAYITSSVGPRGVALSDPALMIALAEAGIGNDDWRSRLSGLREGPLIGQMFWLALFASLFSMYGVPIIERKMRGKGAVYEVPSLLVSILKLLLVACMTGVGGWLLFGLLLALDYVD